MLLLLLFIAFGLSRGLTKVVKVVKMAKVVNVKKLVKMIPLYELIAKGEYCHIFG